MNTLPVPKTFTKRIKPKAPPKSGPVYKKLHNEIYSNYTITDPAGVALVDTVCRCAQNIADMSAIVAREGLTIKNHLGVTVGHPLLREIRGLEACKTNAFKTLNLGTEPAKGNR